MGDEEQRLALALHTLDSLQQIVGECELRVQRKEAELGERISALEGRLLEDVQRAVLEQRAKFRLAVRGVLQAIGEEEERRLALEAAQELRMKEAEAIWREQMLHTHRKLATAVGELTATATERAERAEARMMREMEALGPGSQRLLDAAKAAEERVVSLGKETAAAVDVIRSKHEGYDKALADATHDLEQTASALTEQVEELKRKVEQAITSVDGSSSRADELLARLQETTEREIERAVNLIGESKIKVAKRSSLDAEHLSAAATELQAAAAMVSALRPGPSADIGLHAVSLSRLSLEFAQATAAALNECGTVGDEDTRAPAAVGNGDKAHTGWEARRSHISVGLAGTQSRIALDEEREMLNRWAGSVQIAEATARSAAEVVARVEPLQAALAAQQEEAARSTDKTMCLLENLEEETTQLRFQAAAFIDALPDLQSLGTLPPQLDEAIILMRDRVADWQAHAARLTAQLEAEREMHERTNFVLEQECAARVDVETRIHVMAFERRVRQSYIADATDEIDASFGAAVHAASLPLKIEAERLSKGSYKIHASSTDGKRMRGMTRRIGMVMSPNGIALVRMGAGVVPVAEFLHSLCNDTLSRAMLPSDEEPPSAPSAGWWDGQGSSHSQGGSRVGSTTSSPRAVRRAAAMSSPVAPPTDRNISLSACSVSARAVPPSKLGARPGSAPSSPFLGPSCADARDSSKRRTQPTHHGRPVHTVSLAQGPAASFTKELSVPSIPVASVSLDEPDGFSETEDSPMLRMF